MHYHHQSNHHNSNQQQQDDHVLLPPISISPTTTTLMTRRSYHHQHDTYPRRSSLPASLRDIMHTSVTPPNSSQGTENESSSSSGTDRQENPTDTFDFVDPNPRVTQLATALHSVLTNTDTTTHHESSISIMSDPQSQEEDAFTFSFQIHRNHQDTHDTLVSVDIDMDPSTIEHISIIIHAICESLPLNA